MLGPLPLVHRCAVATAGLAVFGAIGAWIAWMFPTLDPAAMIVVGLVAGAAATYLLIHPLSGHPRVRPGADRPEAAD